METRASTIPLVQNNNEVMQLQNYSFRNELVLAVGSIERASRIAPWSAGNECKGLRGNDWVKSFKSCHWTCKSSESSMGNNSLHDDSSGKVFTSADVACACDRCLVAQKLTKQQSRKKERKKHGRSPSSPGRGGVLEVLQADGLVKGLFFLWEFVLALNKKLRPLMTCRRSLVWWALILIAKCCCDSTRREAAGMGRPNGNEWVKWPLGLISSSSSWLPWAGKRRHVFTCVGISADTGREVWGMIEEAGRVHTHPTIHVFIPNSTFNQVRGEGHDPERCLRR